MNCENKIIICKCRKRCCCDDSHKISSSTSKDKSDDDTCNFFEILAHDISSAVTRRKRIQVSKACTTYRKDYCPKKAPPPVKASTPFSALLIPYEKMCSNTTHKTDFKPYPEVKKKDTMDLTKQKDNLLCSILKFNGKSETQTSFIRPLFKKFCHRNKVSSTKRRMADHDLVIGSGKGQNVASTTTYSSSYKKPTSFKKSEIYVPKTEKTLFITTSKHFHCISQYRDDFRKPKNIKRKEVDKIKVYKLPDIKMQDKTTYRIDFTPKKIVDKKASQWNPEHSIYLTAMDAKQCFCLTRCICSCNCNCSKKGPAAE